MEVRHLVPVCRFHQVSGNRNFNGSEWRGAILYYLFGLASNDRKVTYRPKIDFAGVTLALDMETKRYYAYGQSTIEEPAFSSNPDETYTLATASDAYVEQALLRFVKNDTVRDLVIYLGDDRYLRLSKGQRRSELYIYATRIPRSSLET